MDPDTVLRAILYRLRQACSWRCLGHLSGRWETIYGHWRRWVDSGIWDKVLNEARIERWGQIVVYRLYQLQGSQARSRRRLHKGLRLSVLGRAVVGPTPRFMLWSMGRDGSSTYSSVQGIATILSSESIFAKPLQTASPSLPTRRMILTTSEHFSNDVGLGCCIPPKANRVNPATCDRQKYKKRHRVENAFPAPQGIPRNRYAV